MATRNRRTPHKKQPHKSIAAISSGEKSRIKNARAREKLRKAKEKAHARIEKDYRVKLRQLEKTGFYQPKGKKLTASRKRQITRKFSEFEEYLSNDLYFFVPIPTRSKKRLRKTIASAKQNQLITSPRGVFIQKSPGMKTAKAIYSKKTKSFRIKTTRSKKGATGKKTVTEILPIEPMGSSEKELRRIKADAADMLPLKANQSLAFKVTMAGGDGYSHAIFKDPDRLIKHLDHYKLHGAFRLQFFRAVSVMKTHSERWFNHHPRREFNPYKTQYRGVDKTGRSKIYRPRRSKEWKEGYNAFKAGKLIKANPYETLTQYRQWEDGWLFAAKE